MDSCENTTLVNKFLHEAAAAEQYYCSESMGDLVPDQRDCIVIESNGDCAGEPGEDENTGCERSGDILCRDGKKGESQMVGFGWKELMSDECRGTTVCLKENQGENASGSCSNELMGDMRGDSMFCLENNQGEHVGDSGLKELMGDRCNNSVVCLEENRGESVDDSGSKELIGDKCRDSAVYSNENQGENVDGSFEEELLGDRCSDSTVCSNENQSENVDGPGSKELIGDKDGDRMVCLNENQDGNADGSGSKEMMGDKCDDTAVCLDDNQGENVDGSGLEELMRDNDSTGYSNENQCEHEDCSSTKELMGDSIGNYVVCLDENQGNIDVHDSEFDQLCLKNRGSSGEDGVTAMDGSLGFSEDENTACLSSGMEISSNCEDQMKDDDENVVNLLLKESTDNQGGVCLIENQGKVVHHNSENDASQDGEMPSDLKRVTIPPRNCVKQDKQKDDESVSGSTLQGFMEDVEEKCEEKNDAVKRTGTDVLNQILPSQKCEVPFELINITGEDRNKDDTSTCCPSVEVAMEEKRKILTEIETKICNQMPPVQVNNLSSESIAITSCRSDCPQQIDLKDSNIVRGPALDGKCGASSMIESDMLSQISASCCEETISNLQRTGDSVSSCDSHNQKDDLSSSDLSLESFTKPVETKSNDDVCIELLASKGYLSTLEKLHRAESLCTQQNAQTDKKNVNGPLGDDVAKVFEERTDVTAGTKVESSSEIINAKENACNSKGDSFELGANCLCDKSASLSCQPFDALENGLSGRLDPPDLLTKDACGAISSSSSIDCSLQRENEGKAVVKVDCVSETKHHPTTSSSSRRGSQKSKSSRKAPAKRVARNCRTKLPGPHESIEFLFKASRRKRSCSSKPARSSIWGLFSNITQFLELYHDPLCNEVQKQEPSKARGGRGSGKRSKNRAGQNRKGSSGLSNTSTSCLRLKIKVGKGVAPSNLNSVVAEVVDTLVSVDTSFSNYGKETNLQLPKLAIVVEDKVGALGSERQFQSKEDQEKVKTCSDASIMDLKLANNDVGSAENIEKSAEDVADNYLVSQSDTGVEASGEAIENKYKDPGTSPDSEVINSVPDAQVGLIHQEELHDSVLNTSRALAFPGGAKSSRGSKQEKRGNRRPDSEVINSVPDAQVGLIHQEELHDTVLNTSGALAFPGGAKSSRGSKQEKRGNRRSPGAAGIRKPKSSKNCRGRQKTTDNGFVSSEALTSFPGANSSRENGLGVCEEAMKVEINMDAKACCGPDVPDTKNTKNLSSSKYKRNQLSKSSKSRGVSKGKSRVSDPVRGRKGIACKRRGDELKSVSKSKVKEKGSDEEVVARGGKYPLTVDTAGKHISDDIENSNTDNSIASADMINFDLVSNVLMEQHAQPDNAWVRCDDCHKWRQIPVALVKTFDEASRWICGDNVDKAFADCSVPQEKSNADINAELGISDAEEDGCDGLNYKELEKGFKSKSMTVQPPSHFWRIDSNQFLHRGRKTQTIDEIMVCHCKRPPDGKLGCGDECLNRMLNIECVKGTCPCGDLCSNQQFQKRKYAKLKWDRFSKKGFGLRMLENISAGRFLIEYVGEVLDMQAYEARQKEYASRGQRHFYFMTLNGSEVIDAYVKGNLGRFINHSCDPNCRTEKWMVNEEICIGLFALRDIKKGEEVTFDYNYVRVFGAAAKKCHCGSPHCRGYIGGDPLSAEVIVHDDSDEESPEPKMLEDGETWNGSGSIISRFSSFDGAEMQSVESVITDGVIKLENMPEAEDSLNRSASATSKLNSSVETEDLKGNFQLAIQPEEVLPKTAPCEAVQPYGTMEQKAMNKTSCSIQKLDTSLNMSDNKLPSDIVDAIKKSKSDTAVDKQVPRKSRPLMKTSHSSGSIKKGKISSNSLNGNKVQITSNKSQVPSVKPRKFSENSSACRFEAVEEKLNELLDSEGGITKQKDASKGYLKLLLLTATSGDSGNGEAIQSNRDLSMILDVLLKTKSRLVLTDIINKNGLQMLHNIMKKYRRDFKKIPILRKLLKVLEYLAMRDILTLEHINGCPPCAGRQSFRESMLSLTEHDDKQVHQIARNFRDRWIPKPVRKLSCRDKDEGRMEFHRGLDCNRVSAAHNHSRDQAIRPTEAISCIMQSVAATTSVDTSTHEACSSSSTGVCQTNCTKIRKRKSCWDQPAETEKIDSESPKKLEYSPLPVLVPTKPVHIGKMSRWDEECHGFVCKGEAINVDNGRHSFHEDVPPGFSSPPSASLVSSTAPSTATDIPQPKFCQMNFPDVIIAHPQKRFISRLPVSYGIPLPILQQFGSPQGERVESWVIAPGMPFHPFPPLPPYPRDKQDTPPACAANSFGINEDAEEGQQDSHRPATSYPDENISSTAGGNQPDTDIPCTNIQQTFKRTREFSNDLGKKYFRQQKRKGPPWHKSECMGNTYIDGTCCIDVGNVKNELRNPYYSDDITCTVGEGRNDFCQQPQHPNQH